MSQKDFLKYLDSDEFKTLLQRYEDSLASGEHEFFDADDLIDLAEYYHIEGYLDLSEQAALRCLEDYPNDPSALLFLARLQLLDYDDPGKASEYYDMVEEEEESVESVLVAAEILITQTNMREAQRILTEYYKKWNGEATEDQAYDDYDVEEDEDDSDPVNFPLNVAMLYMDHGYTELAQLWLDKTEPMDDSQKAEMLETQARILSHRQDFEAAEVAWNKLIDIDAYNVFAWIQLCDVQYQQQKLEEALQSAEYAQAISPDLPEAILSRGNCLAGLERYEEAEKCFEEYCKACPNDVTGALLLDSVRYKMGKPKEEQEKDDWELLRKLKELLESEYNKKNDDNDNQHPAAES